MADVPIACSLDATALPERLAEWQHTADRATAVRSTRTGAAATFPLDGDIAAALARLVTQEVSCCPFFAMRLDVGPDGLELSIDAPEGAVDLARQLLDPATPR